MQKSRPGWACKGDLNTKFFHNCMKDRYRRNHLGPILTGDCIPETDGEIKEEVTRFYSQLYAENDYNRPTLNDIGFKALSNEEGELLEAPFTEFEIKNAVWDCESTKSLGPVTPMQLYAICMRYQIIILISITESISKTDYHKK